jgi:hypothetical protein
MQPSVVDGAGAVGLVKIRPLHCRLTAVDAERRPLGYLRLRALLLPPAAERMGDLMQLISSPSDPRRIRWRWRGSPSAQRGPAHASSR